MHSIDNQITAFIFLSVDDAIIKSFETVLCDFKHQMSTEIVF